MEQKQRITTKALIQKNGKVLLVCEANGNWELPGGKPNFGEHMAEAIRREIQEELNVDDMRITGIAGEFDFIAHRPDLDTDYQFEVLVFSVDIGDSEISLSDEHTHFDWFEKSDIAALNMKPEYKDFLNLML